MKGKISILVLAIFLVVLTAAILVTQTESAEAAQPCIAHIWADTGTDDFDCTGDNVMHCYGAIYRYVCDDCCAMILSPPGVDMVLGHGTDCGCETN